MRDECTRAGISPGRGFGCVFGGVGKADPAFLWAAAGCEGGVAALDGSWVGWLLLLLVLRLLWL